MIRRFIDKDVSYCSLFESVGFEYLSSSVMNDFIELISTNFECLTVSVWRRLQSRLIDGPSKRPLAGVDLPFRSGAPLDGIIAYLTKTHNGNVADLGIVGVTSSSVHSAHVAKNAVCFTDSLYTQTSDVANSWLCYDFKAMLVNISHYSIRSRTNGGGRHPQNWTVEGSMYGTTWVELDRRDGQTEFRDVNQTATFSVSRREPARLIRLRQHGENSSGSDFLTLSAFELFGTVHELKG
jgi:hypothetical protein